VRRGPDRSERRWKYRGATIRGGDVVAALRLASEALAADRAYNDKRNVSVNLWNSTAYLMTVNPP
jgi:hypothetical protein